MNIALCCIVKNENLYLLDWFEYHINLGFNHIFIYDNNDTDGEYPEHILMKYIIDGRCTVINMRGMHNMQLSAYNDCYSTYAKQYEWISFIDADEYITLSLHTTIHEYLSLSYFNNIVCIQLNWMCMSDNDDIYYSNKPVTERFEYAVMPLHFSNNAYMKEEYANNPYNSFTKCIVRGGEGIHVNFYSPHICDIFIQSFRGIMTYSNSIGIPVIKSHILIEPIYDLAYIRHYNTKTIVEFLYRRYMRYGTGDGNCIENILSMFNQNKINEEKTNIINRFFEENNNLIK